MRGTNFAAKAAEKHDEMAERLGDAPEPSRRPAGPTVKLTVNIDRHLRNDLKAWCAQRQMTMGEFIAMAAEHRDEVFGLDK